MSEELELTPEKFAALRKRLEGQQKEKEKQRSRSWIRKCDCTCGCTVEHTGRDQTCVLCRSNDHWDRIVTWLDQTMARTRRTA